MSSQSSQVRVLGYLAVAAGLLGLASAAVLLLVPPAVGSDRYSYPFTEAGFSVAQAWFALQHLGLLAALVGLARSGGIGRLGLIGAWVAVAGMLALTGTELIAITGASAEAAEMNTGTVGSLYGISVTVIGAGLLLAGVAVVRARRWRGWRRFITLALGIWVFLPLMPSLFLSFVLARFTIGAWMLGFAALGWALVTSAAPQPVAARAAGEQPA